MVIHKNKKYTLMVYNTVTHRNEEVEVTHEVYHAYRRTGWGMRRSPVKLDIPCLTRMVQ